MGIWAATSLVYRAALALVSNRVAGALYPETLETITYQPLEA